MGVFFPLMFEIKSAIDVAHDKLTPFAHEFREYIYTIHWYNYNIDKDEAQNAPCS